MEGNETELNTGNLPVGLLGTVETILAEAGVAAPIMQPDDIFPENRPILSFFDRQAEECLTTFKKRWAAEAEIFYCFTLSSDTNAFAARSPYASGKYFIIVRGGVAWRLDQILHGVTKDPSVRAFLDLPAMLDEATDHRHQTALVMIAYRWLCYHELGHIKNGHLHLTVAAREGFLREAMGSNIRESDSIIYHTLEMDADAFACGQVCGDLLGMLDSTAKRWPLFRDAKSRMKALVVALYAVMRAFDAANWTLADLFTSSHPPGPIRASLLMAWGEAYFAREIPVPQPLTPPEWADQCKRAITVTEDALRSLDLAPTLPNEISTFLAKDFGRYASTLTLCWSQVRPLLEPHLLGGDLAPAQWHLKDGLWVSAASGMVAKLD
jgi:hypothetical protein